MTGFSEQQANNSTSLGGGFGFHTNKQSSASDSSTFNNTFSAGMGSFNNSNTERKGLFGSNTFGMNYTTTPSVVFGAPVPNSSTHAPSPAISVFGSPSPMVQTPLINKFEAHGNSGASYDKTGTVASGASAWTAAAAASKGPQDMTTNRNVGFPISSASAPSVPLTFGSSSNVTYGSSTTKFNTTKSEETTGQNVFGLGLAPTFNVPTSSTSTGFTSRLSPSRNVPVASVGFSFGSPTVPASQSSSLPKGSNEFAGFNCDASSGYLSNLLNNPTRSIGLETVSDSGMFDQNNLPSTNDDEMEEYDDYDSTFSPSGPRIPRKKERVIESTGVLEQRVVNSSLATESSQSEKDSDHQLALLRAKIQEKKNRLLKMKQNDQLSNNKTFENLAEKKSFQRHSTTPPPLSLSNEELAAKNAVRFASTGNSKEFALKKLLPDDLKDRVGDMSEFFSKDMHTDGNEGDSGENEGGSSHEGVEMDGIDDLEIRDVRSAKSLVGICKSMCPDEELLRREREGDIQILEITDPGGLHPEGWTLRDTAVKRFRRSAADFKLDIPDLVRPPEILERVCGYLEEWVMERDRQGPDRRFTQQISDIPPPLDVYQFIWDRTRMIRKDFILQNYIGTGGKCDARAVRCHERIARWHAMCEHQLSHISEFVTHQSQQNVAELGQTLKTLNLYYDDSLGRSLTEEELETNVDYRQGCGSDIVMGKTPVDYDGRELSNTILTEDVSMRIIGSNGINSPTHGTAEPEMRGLYMLLTMNNEGGMEVLKYSARLCTQRPEIFYSKPVQLALSIFQARKDHNYAKFFRLLRSSSTPYLFSCIMFKYVEQMRKEAIMIMSKTYGTKYKTSGESFYDSYPIERLVKILCYEDETEAREACAHYGISVDGSKIRWRHSKFIQPHDPIKGTILSLRPKKMIRTIECKLKGVTRLSVCRGGVSGDGATLSMNDGLDVSVSPVVQRETNFTSQSAIIETEKFSRELDVDELCKQRQDEARRVEEETRRREETLRREEERKQKEKIIAEQLEVELNKKMLEELKKQEEILIQREEEDARLIEARDREARDHEAAIQRLNREKQERERQQMIEKKRKEEELIRMLALEAEKNRKLEEMMRQKKEAEQKRIAYEIERKQQAEQELQKKIQDEKERQYRIKIESARKIFSWFLRLKQMKRHNRIKNLVHSLESLDPTITQSPASISIQMPSQPCFCSSLFVSQDHRNIDGKIYRLATASREHINLSKMIADYLRQSPTTSLSSQYSLPPIVQTSYHTILLKLTVILPKCCPQTESMYRSLFMWVDSHLHLNSVTSLVSRRRSHLLRIRSVATLGNNDKLSCINCDAVLFLLPSFASYDTYIEGLKEELSYLPEGIPRIVLLLDDENEASNNSEMNQIFESILGPPEESSNVTCLREGIVISNVNHLDRAFRKCCHALIRSRFKSECNSGEFFDYNIAQISLSNFAFLCLQNMLQNYSLQPSLHRNDVFQALFETSKQMLFAMVHKLVHIGNEIEHNHLSYWPAREFLNLETKCFEHFFFEQAHLPSDWHLTLLDEMFLEKKMHNFIQAILNIESLVRIVEKIPQGVTSNLRENLLKMLDNGDLTGCFNKIVLMHVNGEINIECENTPLIYIPCTKLFEIIEISRQWVIPDYEEPRVLADVPHFLYHDMSDHLMEETSIEPASIIKRVDPVAFNKRKLTDDILAISSDAKYRKQIKTVCTSRVETEDERNSKQYTSILESFLL